MRTPNIYEKTVFGPFSVSFFAFSVIFFLKIIVLTIPDILAIFFFRSQNLVTPKFGKICPKNQFLDRFPFKSCRFPLVFQPKKINKNSVHGLVWGFLSYRYSVYLKIIFKTLKNAHFSVFGPFSV